MLVIVDDGNVQTESNTIVRCLAAKHRRFYLSPEDPLARARVEEMMDWQATEFNFAWRPAFPAIVRKIPNSGTEAQIRQSPIARLELPRIREYLDRLMQGPASRPHLGGDTD